MMVSKIKRILILACNVSCALLLIFWERYSQWCVYIGTATYNIFLKAALGTAYIYALYILFSIIIILDISFMEEQDSKWILLCGGVCRVVVPMLYIIYLQVTFSFLAFPRELIGILVCSLFEIIMIIVKRKSDK